MTDNVEEETEVSYTLTVPEDGGWGWVVVAASFYSLYIQNGIIFSFGTKVESICKELSVPAAPVALIGSIQIALYFMMCPFASALINRYGFRICSIVGSILCSFSIAFTYISGSYIEVLLSYGVFNGIGLACLQMSSSLIVGFYFEKKRSLALAISALGASLGTMLTFPLFSYLIKLCGSYKPIILLESGFVGIVYFTSLTYRPLATITVMEVDEYDVPQRSVAVIPKIKEGSKGSDDVTQVERMLGSVSNYKYPTADKLLQQALQTSTTSIQRPISPVNKAGTTDAVFKQKSIIIKPSTTAGFTSRQLKVLQSRTTAVSSPQVTTAPRISVVLPEEPILKPKTTKHHFLCCCCWEWESEPADARPMYRDDTFYEGNIQKLPTYQKSVMGVPEEQRTGLEYQMAVARAVTADDLEEQKGQLCTPACKRVLATMLDFTTMLKIRSFILICISGLLCYIGMLPPYIFVTDRNNKEGLEGKLYVSVIGLATTVARLFFGVIGDKISPVLLYALSLMMAGLASILSTLHFTYWYQYSYAAVYGFCVGGVVTMRCLVLIGLYGLSKLTNATGLFHIFLGIGCAVGSPLAGAIRDSFGYSVSFYVSGGSLIASGLLIVCVRTPKEVAM